MQLTFLFLHAKPPVPWKEPRMRDSWDGSPVAAGWEMGVSDPAKSDMDFTSSGLAARATSPLWCSHYSITVMHISVSLVWPEFRMASGI